MLTLLPEASWMAATSFCGSLHGGFDAVQASTVPVVMTRPAIVIVP